MKVGMIGAGAFGTALGEILINKGVDVYYYDTKIEDSSLAEATEGAQFVVLCVPSSALDEVLEDLPKDIPMIVATKGILSNNVFSNFDDYMVMSGPGFADDIKNHQPALLTATDKRIIELFGTDYLSFDFTEDVLGVLMCGALKNVYAIGAGLLGLKPEVDGWEQYISDVCHEMGKILSLNGADGETVQLACGVGDLRLSCNKPSRNYEFGDRLRLEPDYRPIETVEGIATIKRISEGMIKLPENCSILNTIMERTLHA